MFVIEHFLKINSKYQYVIIFNTRNIKKVNLTLWLKCFKSIKAVIGHYDNFCLSSVNTFINQGLIDFQN